MKRYNLMAWISIVLQLGMILGLAGCCESAKKEVETGEKIAAAENKFEPYPNRYDEEPAWVKKACLGYGGSNNELFCAVGVSGQHGSIAAKRKEALDNARAEIVAWMKPIVPEMWRSESGALYVLMAVAPQGVLDGSNEYKKAEMESGMQDNPTPARHKITQGDYTDPLLGTKGKSLAQAAPDWVSQACYAYWGEKKTYCSVGIAVPNANEQEQWDEAIRSASVELSHLFQTEMVDSWMGKDGKLHVLVVADRKANKNLMAEALHEAMIERAEKAFDELDAEMPN